MESFKESWTFGRNISKSFKSEKTETPKNESTKKINSAYDFLRDTYQSSDDFSSDSDDSLKLRSENYFTKQGSIVSQEKYRLKRCETMEPSEEIFFNSSNYKALQESESLNSSVKKNVLENEDSKIPKDHRSQEGLCLEKNKTFYNTEKLEKDSKVLNFASKVSERKFHNYCCSYCQTKNEVNFRYGRLSECKACESKKAVYRRNLKLKGAFRSDGSYDESFDVSPILVCSDCISRDKVCEICTKIQEKFKVRVQELKAYKSQNYCCLSCGTNVAERFAEGCYSRCRACKNDLQAQKYREAKLRAKEEKLKEVSFGSEASEELERRRLVKTIPSRVETLELQVSELLKSESFLKTELEELKMENFGLRETFEDTFADLKKQIKELKFIYRK